MQFARFDTRRYRTLPVAAGYRTWAPTYDRTMRRTPIDRPLLDRLTGVRFPGTAAADLGCGTGRMGRWLRSRGCRIVDGIDASVAMLRIARRSRRYRRLRRGPVTRTGFSSGAYDLAISSLVACHLPDLRPFYREISRLVTGSGSMILVDYHPHFLLNGIPTHFPSASGRPVAIRNEVHLLSDHVKAATAAGWRLDRLDELTVPRAWLASNPGWTRHLHRPVSFLTVWRR